MHVEQIVETNETLPSHRFDHEGVHGAGVFHCRRKGKRRQSSEPALALPP
jgi:hypothetical protein